MSVSTYIVGIKPPDEKWLQMKAVWDACALAAVEVPTEVDEFFNWEEPDDSGVIVSLGSLYQIKELGQRQTEDGLSYYLGDGQSGIEIELSKIPKDIKKLRFYNSY